MKLTMPGRDVIIVTEENLEAPAPDDKIHLVKLQFNSPTREKVAAALDNYYQTNRFIISSEVKFYNNILRTTNKKYYVQNSPGQAGLISFFRKNNKVLLSVPVLEKNERDFVLKTALLDVLKNLEVILLTKEMYEDNAMYFEGWGGNLIIVDPITQKEFLY